MTRTFSMRTALIFCLLALIPLGAQARSRCDSPCLARAADHHRAVSMKRLVSRLAPSRRAAQQADEQTWQQNRDQLCDGRPACTIAADNSHARFLRARYRACVRSRCSDLDFFNTQDGDLPDTGPQLTRFPAISRYHGADAGYIAVYAHDKENALYTISDDVSVVGFIRLRGRYDGQIFQPMGYANKDISADRAFKRMTQRLFPGHPQGTWAGGDTGGFTSSQN
jgi:hypothetical protein